jgi:hypothetical protein
MGTFDDLAAKITDTVNAGTYLELDTNSNSYEYINGQYVYYYNNAIVQTPTGWALQGDKVNKKLIFKTKSAGAVVSSTVEGVSTAGNGSMTMAGQTYTWAAGTKIMVDGIIVSDVTAFKAKYDDVIAKGGYLLIDAGTYYDYNISGYVPNNDTLKTSSGWQLKGVYGYFGGAYQRVVQFTSKFSTANVTGAISAVNATDKKITIGQTVYNLPATYIHGVAQRRAALGRSRRSGGQGRADPGGRGIHRRGFRLQRDRPFRQRVGAQG